MSTTPLQEIGLKVIEALKRVESDTTVENLENAISVIGSAMDAVISIYDAKMKGEEASIEKFGEYNAETCMTVFRHKSDPRYGKVIALIDGNMCTVYVVKRKTYTIPVYVPCEYKGKNIADGLRYALNADHEDVINFIKTAEEEEKQGEPCMRQTTTVLGYDDFVKLVSIALSTKKSIVRVTKWLLMYTARKGGVKQ
mgnify:CR=1 FL=1